VATERLPALSGVGYRTRMLVVLSLAWAALQCGRFLLPPLLPRIQGSLGLSPAAAGLALTLHGVVYAAVQYPSGAYSDTLSRAALIFPGFVIVLAGFGMLSFAVATPIFLVSVVVLGVGKGLFTSPSRAMVGDLFTDRRGRALGLYTAGTDLGGLLAAGLAVAVLTTTWRLAFVPVVVALALVTVLFLVWNEDPYDLRRIQLSPGDTLGRIAASPAQRDALVAYSLFYFVIGGIVNFYPSLLVAGGFGEGLASGAFALLFLICILTKPVAGDISDRFSRLGVSIVGLLLGAAGIAVVVVSDSLLAVGVGTVVAAAGFKTQFPIADAVVMETAPAGNRGGDLGAARAVFLCASALGPGFVGLVAQVSDYEVAFWALAGLFVLAAAVLARQYRRG